MDLKRKILVVEDNLLNREMLTEILKEQYNVLQAENGKEGLDILKKNKDSIALILLDVMMPVMDGYTFLDIVKANAELSLIPVIVMTQGSSEEDEIAALDHGATDFVPKPYRPKVILNRAESLITLRETSAMVNQFKYDRLTGLYTKEFFYQKVRERLNEDLTHEYNIVCSDIENFKLYNDTFGREAGDRLLCECASLMKTVIGKSGICCRYGADCFFILKSREEEREDREQFFGKMYSERPEKVKKVSVKWGIYEITDRTVSIEQMCDRALLAAKSVKGQYDKPFAVYDDELRNKLQREKAIADSMEAALREEQFQVYLQPKYNLSCNRMMGAEALVRWIHPEWGFMSPGEFIPLFEKNGFIPKLDLFVWEHVCAQLKAWREKGYPLPVISVNVSRADIYQLDLVDTLLEITQKYGIEPAHLHLEITESAYAENPGRIISTVKELRRLGFIVEMDDFGSGYSSLNMLSRMKIDILKLDMKFVQNETAKPEEQSILNDIISMAHKIHMSVVAEGIETRDQMKQLQAMGCDYAQGYYFSKPLPVNDFEKLWKEECSRTGNPSPDTSRNEPPKPTLLVADEDDEYREKIRQTFKDKYKIMEAPDSGSALSYISSYGKDGISALIVSMTLPGDGAEAILKTMRQNPALWDIPVLATIPNSGAAEGLRPELETDDFLCKCHPMFDLQRRVQRLLDIAALRKRESDLQDEACHDHLTELLNRRGLQRAMTSLRTEDLPLAICLFDLDDLKNINDTYGHDAGDEMLRSFAGLLRQKTRDSDIRCRYGGDEFMVIVKSINDTEAVKKKGKEICEAFRSCLAEEKLPASCSGGIVMCREDGRISESLIERADEALYRAKRENKGFCCLWEE